MDSKEELKLLLSNYKGILNKEMLEYLNAIIELEFSALKEKLSDVDQKSLSELEIYKKAFIYNVCTRAYSLVKKEIQDLEFYCYSETAKGFIRLEDENVDLFKFNFAYLNATLYQNIESREKRELEIKRLRESIQELNNRKNPHLIPNAFGENLYYGLALVYDKDREREIRDYEYVIEQLALRNDGLTDNERRKIEVTNTCLEILMKDYDLKEEDFIRARSINSFMEESYYCPQNKILNFSIERRYL